jgi:hypothetical protein
MPNIFNQCFIRIFKDGGRRLLLFGTLSLMKRHIRADFRSNSLVLPLVPVWRLLPHSKVVGY